MDEKALARGLCRVPASWRIEWWDGERWQPVAGTSGYDTRKDGYNRVSFAPVETTALGIDVQLKRGYSGGISE